VDPRDLEPQPIVPPPAPPDPPEPDLEPRPPVITPDPLQARLIPGELAVLAVIAVIVLVGAWVSLEFIGMVSESPDPSSSAAPTRGAQSSPSPTRSATASDAPSTSATPSSSASPVPSATPGASWPVVNVGTGPQLDGRWRRIREAPIGGRTNAAVAWTGTELLVWGGFNGEARWGDGGAYDPAANTWRRLPKSPLSARMSPAHAWSGREFLIWGGFRGSHAPDGAAYDPTTNRWRSLPDAPLTAGPAAGAWTNGGFLVVTGAPSAALYDPEANAWTELGPPPLDAGRIELVVVTGRVFAIRPSTAPDEPTQIALMVRADRTWRRLVDGPPSSAEARPIAAAPFLLLETLAFETDARVWTALDLDACAFEPSSAAATEDALVMSPGAALNVAAPACRAVPTPPGRPEGGDRIDAAVAWNSTGPYGNDGVAFTPAD
jgi:hypothetical protein